jgi:hypothetical protein
MNTQKIPFPGLELRDGIRRSSLKLAPAYVAEVLKVRPSMVLLLLVLLLLLGLGLRLLVVVLLVLMCIRGTGLSYCSAFFCRSCPLHGPTHRYQQAKTYPTWLHLACRHASIICLFTCLF